MRTPLVAANWKMNTTEAEAFALVDAMLPRLQAIADVERVICPPFPWLAPLRERLSGTGVLLGAQNAATEPKGAYTGEVSVPMLQGLVDYVILGHSERRQYYGETDAVVNRKLRAVFDGDLRPILCIGENLDQNEAGETQAVLDRQLRGALDGIEPSGELVIAYEPIWAIGTGRAATAHDANESIAFIRGVLGGLHGGGIADEVRILYGGSVTPDNFAELMAQPEIDGGLVGGASLKADSFVRLVAQASEAAKG